MPRESLPDTPASGDAAPSLPGEDAGEPGSDLGAELPVELSQFNQRLASFGLGVVPDPLLTEATPQGKRRTGR